VRRFIPLLLVGMLTSVVNGDDKAATQLSKEEADQGFVSVFDGSSLKGWKAIKKHVAENGMLVCEKGGSGNLMTEASYGDFVFRFEYRLQPGGNNGVSVRGHEIQILDDDAPQYKKLKECQYNGSIYCKVPAKRGHTKPAGQWNNEEIMVKGTHWKVTLNGTVIVDADIAKVEGLEGVAKTTKAPIGFMAHGDRVEFRNLRIKELKKD
jgi:hypothetical protein